MSNILTVMTVLVLLLLLLWVHLRRKLVVVRSVVDGNSYMVRDVADKQAVADRLAQIRMRLQLLVDHMATHPKYSSDPRVQRLVSRWPRTEIRETGSTSTDAAFSLNKGQQIAFCVRTVDGRLEDLNTSMYVALHEISHVATRDYNGHDKEFWDTMRFIMQAAIQDLHIYEYDPYDTTPTSYCGHRITQNPFTCVHEGTCHVK